MPRTYNSTLPAGYYFASSDDLSPIEIIDLRTSVNWFGDTEERWLRVIEQSLDIITVRSSSGRLVGAACLAGNLRHAVICDLAVRPGHQHMGIGGAIMSKLERLVVDLDVKYAYAELAATNPFRQKMIESGFRETGNSLFCAR